MKITEISNGRGVKKHIHIDGAYGFTVDSDFLYMTEVRVGAEFGDEEIKALKREYEAYCTKKRAMDLLSRRSHSSAELKKKLMTKTDEEIAAKAVEKMSELGFIDDSRFAEDYAAELWNRKNFSLSRIKRELIFKGIDSETAENTVAVFECDEREHLRDVVSRSYISKTKTERCRKSLFSLLVRLGYSYGDIRSVLNEYSENECYGD